MKTTPLYEEHLALKARMVSFAEFMMPVYYAGVLEEHLAVRKKAGIFDVSHMGEILIRGKEALPFVQYLLCNDVSRLKPGRAQYTAMLTERGTFVDDLLVYFINEEHFLLVVNAANTHKDFAWIQKQHAFFKVQVENESHRWAQIALQGPKSQGILQSFVREDLASLKSFRFIETHLQGKKALISRTGYTGEDGFEIYCLPEDALDIWRTLLATGEVTPCGLGARDSLRLEACLMLYGNDIDEETTPWEVHLDWIVKLNKGDFIGREKLLQQKAQGVSQGLIGFEMESRIVPRKGYPVFFEGKPVGRVTSGTYSPYLKKSIGLAKIKVPLPEPGQKVEVEIRNRHHQGTVKQLPFYSRRKP